MGFLKKLDDSVHKFLYVFLFLIGASMTTIVFLGVLFRYVIKAPLPWAEEASRYLMVWGASLGAAIAYREGAHVAVTVAVEKLPQRLARPTILAGRLAVGFFAIVAGLWGLILIARFKGQTSPAMGIPMAIPYFSIPVGCLLILYESAILTIGLAKNALKSEAK